LAPLQCWPAVDKEFLQRSQSEMANIDYVNWQQAETKSGRLSAESGYAF